jgi:uncharacterized membrane protein YkvI
MTIAGAVILAAIAGTLHWKKKAPRFVAWLLLFVGLGAAGVIVQYAGAFTGASIYGVGIFTLIAIICGIVFYEEAIKRNGIHRARTPIVAVLLGVSLVSLGGTAGNAIRHATQSSGTQINKSVTTLFNSKG